MTFTVAIFEVLTKLGVPPSEADQAAYLHRWSVIGHLLGIRPDLLPIEPASAVELTAAIRRRETNPTADSRLLTASLRRRPPARAVAALPGHPPGDGALVRRRPAGRRPRGPTVGWRFLLEGPLHDLAHRIGLDTARSHARRRVVRRWNRRVMRQFLRANRNGDRPDFDIPDELAAVPRFAGAADGRRALPLARRRARGRTGRPGPRADERRPAPAADVSPSSASGVAGDGAGRPGPVPVARRGPRPAASRWRPGR